MAKSDIPQQAKRRNGEGGVWTTQFFADITAPKGQILADNGLLYSSVYI